MKHFTLLQDSIRVSEALSEIKAHPMLWGENPERTAVEGSPHADSLDIWLRFRARDELVQPEDFAAPHFAVFYPSWQLLPSLHPILFNLARKVKAVYIGGVMLTRLPAGGQILPHVDDGWHARFHNVKAYVILQANDGCLNLCGDDPEERVMMQVGQAWKFDNHVTHSVQNNGETDRIAMIATFRVEG